MPTGTITHWKTDRGFGFAARDDGQGEIFIHFRSIAAALGYAGRADLDLLSPSRTS